MTAQSQPLPLEAIVEAGLCIGCGLCAGLAGPGRIRMVATPEGRERPLAVAPLSADTLARIDAICPGTGIPGPDPATLPADTETDLVWGPATTKVIAHAAEPAVRHQGASGGVLTALGQYLLRTGEVAAVLHVKADPAAPLRTVATVSETPEAVLAAAGSRYGPAAALEPLPALLEQERPFAVIAKPCDIGAVRRLMAVDERARKWVRYALTLICGGAPEQGKWLDVLAREGVAERDLRLFRFRGHGNPGPTRVETRDGRCLDLDYNELWADEANWRIQPRCKICPDAIGETGDLVAADCWPGGMPTGEDAGFNAVLVRTARGADLYGRAVADGVLRVVRTVDFRELDDYQPHQVQKKRAVWARLAGMRAAGLPIPRVTGLRIESLARGQGFRALLTEARGARMRAHAGRLGEPPARPAPVPDASE